MRAPLAKQEAQFLGHVGDLLTHAAGLEGGERVPVQPDGRLGLPPQERHAGQDDLGFRHLHRVARLLGLGEGPTGERCRLVGISKNEMRPPDLRQYRCMGNPAPESISDAQCVVEMAQGVARVALLQAQVAQVLQHACQVLEFFGSLECILRLPQVLGGDRVLPELAVGEADPPEGLSAEREVVLRHVGARRFLEALDRAGMIAQVAQRCTERDEGLDPRRIATGPGAAKCEEGSFEQRAGRGDLAAANLDPSHQHQGAAGAPEVAGCLAPDADLLGMPHIRALEVATFYTMFSLEPRGEVLVQLCGTTPCMLRGSEELKKVCKRRIGDEHHVSADGKFSWIEVECLGACVNAPMVQINEDYYEDLTPETFEKILDQFAAGKKPKPGPQIDRQFSAPVGGPTTLLQEKK